MIRRLLIALSLAGAASAIAQADEPQVLTSIAPLQLIAAAITEGGTAPDVLLPANASAHYYALRPSDLRRLQSADVFYWIGPDMETFLQPLVGKRKTLSVAVQDEDGLVRRFYGKDGSAHEEHDEHGHSDHDHDHRPGSLDAHLWLSPKNAKVIAARMAKDLSEMNPESAARYQQNLANFTQLMDETDQKIKGQLAPLQGKPYFVFHEAYDYFESAYGLQHTGVFTVQGDVQPGAQHVAALRSRLEKAGPACVFYEPPTAPRIARTLIQGLPVQLAELDGLGGQIPLNAQAYPQLLLQVSQQIQDCFNALPAR